MQGESRTGLHGAGRVGSSNDGPPYVKIVYAPKNGDDPARRPHNVLSEAKALGYLSHANIVELLGYTYDNGTHQLILPRLAFTLQDVLDDFPRVDAGDVFRSVAYQALRGMAYLHAKGIAHRDVNPGNIMFDWDGTVKYIDFGIAFGVPSQSTTEKAGEMVCEVGTGPYRAPELLFNDTSYDPQAIDLWALGTVLAEILIDPVWAEQEDRTRTLFSDFMGDIGLAASIFRLRGTPTKDSWPEFGSLPDAGKMDFDHFGPQPLSSVLTRLPKCKRDGCAAGMLDGLLQYSASRRTPAGDILASSLLFHDPIHVPSSYPADESKDLIRGDHTQQTFHNLFETAKKRAERCTS